MRSGWACCRRRGRSAEVSGVRLATRLSEPATDRWDIDGHPERRGLCRIAYRNDIGSVEGRALDKKGANSACRWEASPSPDSVRPTANCGARINPISPLFRPANHEYRRTFIQFNFHASLPCHNGVRLIVGNALWSHSDASGASTPASALPGKGTARTRP
jgi:hypothetical protein